MKEITSQLTKKFGISEAQAKQAIEMIANFIGDRLPLVKDQLKNLLNEKTEKDSPPQIGGINVQELG